MTNATGRPIAPLILSPDERAYLERRHCHVWTAPADQGLFSVLRGSWVRSCLRPFAPRRNFPIARLAPKDCEGNARHLVGERHGDEVERLLLDELLRPCAQRIRMGFTMKQHGMRPHDEQFAQISIAHLRNTPEPLLASRRVLLRR